MSNTIRFDQKEHYQIATKYIGKNQIQNREQAISDVRTLTSTMSRTVGTPQNISSTSIPINQLQQLQPQTPSNSYKMRGSYTNLSSIVEQNNRFTPQNNRNSSLQSHQNSTVNKQMQHRRLKQSDDTLKSNTTLGAKSTQSFQQSQQQFIKEHGDKISIQQRESAATAFFHQKLQSSSMKSIHYLDQGNISQRSLISTKVLSSVENQNVGQNANFFSLSQKNLQGSLTNLDSAYASKRGGNIDFLSNHHLGSTQSLNDNFSQKFEWIDKIEGKQFQSATTFDPSEYLSLNAQKKERKQQINVNKKFLNIFINRRVKERDIQISGLQFGENQQQELDSFSFIESTNPWKLIDNKTINSQMVQDGILNVIRCDINEFIYFKMKIFEKNSPLRVKFIVEKNSSNIRLYVSRTCLQPNNFNCDYVFNNTKVICIEEEKNQSIFKRNNFLYFSLVSDQEQDIQIKYTFGQETKRIPNIDFQNRQSITSIPNFSNIENIQRLNNNQLRQSVQEIFQGKQQKINDAGNFLKRNIDETQQIDMFTKNLTAYAKKKETYNHLLNVIKKAQEKKDAKQQAIEDEQESRLKKQIDKIKKFRYDFFCYFWIQIIYLAKLSSIMNAKFVEKKEVIKNFSKIAWRAHPLTMKFRRFYKQYPKNMNLNNLRYAKITMGTLAHFIKKKKKKEAGHLITRTLRYNSQYSQLWVKMNKYHQIIVTVQQSYKIFRIKKANFKKLLFRLWDKYYFMGMEQTIEVKKTEDNEQLFWRKKQNVLNTINSLEVKTYAIDSYFIDQMLDFRQKIGNYLHMMRHAPKEQKKKIRILQAFLNNEEIQRSSLIFEDSNQNADLDVSFDNVAADHDQTHQATNFIKKPRLFVVPTFKSIKSVFRRGVIYYASQNPNIMEKITLKEV